MSKAQKKAVEHRIALWKCRNFTPQWNNEAEFLACMRALNKQRKFRQKTKPRGKENAPFSWNTKREFEAFCRSDSHLDKRKSRSWKSNDRRPKKKRRSSRHSRD